MYKHKLRKYITKCNSESEVAAAWSAPRVKVASLTPEKATPPCHLLCYIVTRKLRFYKRTQRETREPQRAAAFLSQSSLLFFQSASFSRNLVARPVIPRESFSKKKKENFSQFSIPRFIYIYSTVRIVNVVNVNLANRPDFRNIFRLERVFPKHPAVRAFSCLNAFRRASLPLLIRKALGIPGEAFSVSSTVEGKKERERGRERRISSRKFWERVWRELGFELLYINITSGEPTVLPSKLGLASPYLEGWGERGEKKVDWQHVARS